MTRLGYIVNPTHGTAWMPTDEAIPVGNIAPMSRLGDPRDTGPRVYLFPRKSYLYPDQRIAVRLFPQLDSGKDAEEISRRINICMFGELEVK